MDCSVCGSQDTTFKQGVGKKGPWSAYDCNEPECKNDKGYPNRTFVPRKKAPMATPAPRQSVDLSSVNKKLDLIMKALNIKTETKPEPVEDDSAPF